ncbi:hypothetical protein PtrEW4_008264 [Pyrenophora tritici-repentis]|nr:hypothetical protein PtrEW4_008264 [Pyrenophora tritici-repentis]PZC91977.1 hypothetical protein A1F95_08341 [Pyrenophora tritici-repentis]
MRYSSALVLSTIVVGQAAAANLHNRHASFHARRQAAEAKRNADEVDWSKVAYDLGDPADKPADKPAAAAKVTPVAEVEVTKEDVPSSSPPMPSPTPSPKPSKPSGDNSIGGIIGDVLGDVGDAIGEAVDDLMHGVQEVAEKLNCKIGKNDKSNNGKIWIGDDSKYTIEFINNKADDAVLYCWASNGYNGMIVTKFEPEISVAVKSGKSVTLSWAADVPSACAPVFSGTTTSIFGGIDNTWLEMNFGQWGTFDVSRNVNMKGDNISAKGSKCTSDMETCVFVCKNGMASCEKGSDYTLKNCHSGNGGGGGWDVNVAGVGGGCSMGANSEHIKAVLG